tara:strand:- start:579 stop:1034 length:456 start_codon:yes stop_codon:yes gene_type:complete
MAYGSLKIDTLIYDNSGSDVSLSVSGIPSSAAINAKAPLASPTFTGTVTIPSGASIAGYATTASLSSYATIASPAFTSDIELSAQAPLKFMDGDSSHYVAFRAPATVAANVTWTLPATDAAGQLTSDGSGQLSWAAASGGGVSLGLSLALG